MSAPGIAFRISPRGGGIVEYPIPPDGLDIGGGTRLLDGQEDEHWRPWTLDRVAVISERVGPWVTVWCAPKVEWAGERWGGRYMWGRDTCAVATAYSAGYTVSTAYHELAHALDDYLLPHARAVLDAATSGVDWPGDYLSDPAERRARFIEHVCAALDHGVALHVEPNSATEAAWAFYTGEYARQRDAAIAAAKAARVAAARPSLFARMREMAHV